jgi:hypothetical protein
MHSGASYINSCPPHLCSSTWIDVGIRPRSDNQITTFLTLLKSIYTLQETQRMPHRAETGGSDVIVVEPASKGRTRTSNRSGRTWRGSVFKLLGSAMTTRLGKSAFLAGHCNRVSKADQGLSPFSGIVDQIRRRLPASKLAKNNDRRSAKFKHGLFVAS